MKNEDDLAAILAVVVREPGGASRQDIAKGLLVRIAADSQLLVSQSVEVTCLRQTQPGRLTNPLPSQADWIVHPQAYWFGRLSSDCSDSGISMVRPFATSSFHFIGCGYPNMFILLPGLGFTDCSTSDLPGHSKAKQCTVRLSFVLVNRIDSPSRQYSASLGRVA